MSSSAGIHSQSPVRRHVGLSHRQDEEESKSNAPEARSPVGQRRNGLHPDIQVDSHGQSLLPGDPRWQCDVKVGEWSALNTTDIKYLGRDRKILSAALYRYLTGSSYSEIAKLYGMPRSGQSIQDRFTLLAAGGAAKSIVSSMI